MDMEIKNRIEAFLSWKTSGVKPIGWDLEPQNKQEMWIAEEAKRLDSIEYGENGGEITRKAPVKVIEGTNDYNELENIPILPIDEELVEGKYYYQVGKNIESIISTSEILSKVKFDRTADWNNYLSNLDFQEDSILPIAMGGFEEGICAFDYSKASLMVDSGYAIIYFNPEPEVGEQIEFIYSTVEVSDPRVAPVSIGFQSNVDENGYYNIPSESLIPSVVDSSINGTLLKGVYTTKDIIGQVRNKELKPLLTKTPIYRHVKEAKGGMGRLNFTIYNDSQEILDWSAIKAILTEEDYIHPAAGIYNGLTVAGIANDPLRSGCINIYQLYQGQFHEVSVETASLSLYEDTKTLF